MNYIIKDLKKKNIASLKKDVIEATVEEVGTNKIIEKVQIWQGFPNFETITFGSSVEGEIVDKMNGNYRNITLYPPKVQATPKSGGFGGVKVAQERKAEFIKEAQERKSDSIAYFNSVNSAIELVTKRGGIDQMTDQDIELALVYWRNWFLSEYRKYEAQDISDKKAPF